MLGQLTYLRHFLLALLLSNGSNMSCRQTSLRRKKNRLALLSTIFFGVSIGLPWFTLHGQSPQTRRGGLRFRFTDAPAQPPVQQKNNSKPEIPATKIERPSLKQQPQEAPNTAINVATEEERNQSIALDWKDPWVVFFVTGRQYGYMEPCGCTGLENQKGGLMRRDTLLSQIRKRGWNVLPIDAGNQVRSRGKQSEIKYDWTAKAFAMMDYAAVSYGEDDLKLNLDVLLYPLINAPTDASGNQQPLYVSANISVFPEIDIPYKVVKVSNRKIGITSVLGDENASKLVQDEDGVKVKPAREALSAVAKKMQAEKCDYQVLIAHASLEESRVLAQTFPQFQLVITAGGYGEPTYRPEVIPGTATQMVQVGVKGMYAGIVGLFDDPKQPLRYQRLAMSSQFEDSPRMVELFGKYQDQLKAEGMERLGKRPQLHPTGREFVGSEKCGECHTTAFDIWKSTPHSHATDSIVEPPERPIPRHFDPECLSCHTTGWNPQEFFPYKTGYDSLETTPLMVANGCENCHGPGKNHSAAEAGDIQVSKEIIAKLRQEMQLPLAKAHDTCLECHDIDNSPDFHRNNAFEEYWEKVKHYGKD